MFVTEIRDISNWSEKMRSGFMALYGEKYFREQWSNWVDAYDNYFKKCKGKIVGRNLTKHEHCLQVTWTSFLSP